jgi:hypothetical protein
MLVEDGAGMEDTALRCNGQLTPYKGAVTLYPDMVIASE